MSDKRLADLCFVFVAQPCVRLFQRHECCSCSVAAQLNGVPRRSVGLQERVELQRTLQEERANNMAERQRLQSATTAAEHLAQQSTGQVGCAAAVTAFGGVAARTICMAHCFTAAVIFNCLGMQQLLLTACAAELREPTTYVWPTKLPPHIRDD